MRDHALTRSRLMIDLSPALRRRIKIAAAQRDLSVRQYVEGILEQTVPEMATDTSVAPPLDTAVAARIDAVRERAMHGRVFTDDSAALLREMRSTRLERS